MAKMETAARVVNETCEDAAGFAVFAEYVTSNAMDRANDARDRGDKADAARWQMVFAAMAALAEQINDDIAAAEDWQDEQDARFARDAAEHDDSPSLDDHPWSIFQRGERE